MTLHTHLSVDECNKRLTAAVDIEKLAFSMSGYSGSKDILGRIRGTDFRLQKRRFYRNSFAPYFYGRFVASDRGVVIEGEFRMHPFVRVFMTLWFSFLAVFIGLMLFSLTKGRVTTRGNPAFAFLIPFCMVVFGVALIKFGWWLGRNEKEAITRMMKDTFEANAAG